MNLNLKKPTVTVVIPTYNAGPHIVKLLNSLQEQSLTPSQILIVDSGSSDETAKLARNLNCKVIAIDCADFDHGTTRNLAMSEVSTEFAIFLTQDVTPADKHMIAELIKPMQADPNTAICYGRQLPNLNAGQLEKFARQFNYPAESVLKTKDDIEAMGLRTFFCSNSCSAIRCDTFKKLGGFKKNVIANEDMLFAAKAILQNYSVYYSATAKVYHSHPYSLFGTFKRYFKIGRFFADNKEIFKNAGLKSYSSDMLKAGIKTFWEKRMPHYIFVLFIEFVTKAFACKLGWHYQLRFRKKGRHFLS